jgi:hypothetical protein
MPVYSLATFPVFSLPRFLRCDQFDIVLRRRRSIFLFPVRRFGILFRMGSRRQVGVRKERFLRQVQ